MIRAVPTDSDRVVSAGDVEPVVGEGAPAEQTHSHSSRATDTVP
ncbi:MAG: hypothetical protein ACI8XM_000469 [Haloarculaceae archaeon]|jgi:hypothetical protein